MSVYRFLINCICQYEKYLLQNSNIGLNALLCFLRSVLLRFLLSKFHDRPVNYVTIINEDRKLVSQYKLHANKHIYGLISLQLQVINSFKYVKMEIYHKNRYLHYRFKVGKMFCSKMQSMNSLFAI